MYECNFVERIAGHFKQLIEKVIENARFLIKDVDILTKQEREQIIYGFNDTKADYPEDKTFHELFEEQVEKVPERTAVVFENKSLTYRELNQRANSLAWTLREKGVGTDKIVAIMLEKSLEMIIGVLAVLKAGGAYLPIDPGYPQDRIKYMLDDSSVKILLTDEMLKGEVQFEGIVIWLNDDENYMKSTANLPVMNKSKDLAYLIYTSGTTGNPKGVLVEHRNFVNISFGWKEGYKLKDLVPSVLQMASFSFDVFCGDLSRALVNGGQLVICPDDKKLDFKELSLLIEKCKINFIETTPAFVVLFMDYVYSNNLDISSLKLLVISSDACRTEDFNLIVSRFGNTIRVLNTYGITETTIDSSYFDGALDNFCGSFVPIGKPMNNTCFYILDENLYVQPIGIAGELFIGGSGVARGYLNNPELNAQKFIENPFMQGQKMYRTGDLAMWMPDGNVKFLGRVDNQVKIRGFRIELEEIESLLLKHKYVKEAVVVAKDDESGSKYLCAYLVCEEELDISIIREYLLKELPEYMIPSYFIQLDKIPLTANGKIDRKAFPEARWQN